jgi:hypothetical protein
MAAIEQRLGPDGKLVHRVRVRRKGTPIQTATFPKLADAKRWAQMIEGRVSEGRHFPSTKPTRPHPRRSSRPLHEGSPAP